MSEPKTYTASDIERYHSGQMPPAEMHRLEKAALDDPFLADMLDGYRLTPSASADLQSLQQKLQLRLQDDRQKTRVIGLPWLRIAALFVLLAGGGWLVFQTGSSKSRTIASSQENESLPATTDAPAQAIVQAPLPFTATDSVPRPTDVAVNKSRPRKQRPVELQQEVQSPAASNDKDLSKALGNTAAGISVMNAEARRPDSATANAAVSDQALARATTDTSRRLDIVMKKLDTPMEEVVVSKRKQNAVRRYEPRVVIDTLEPEQGWSSLDSYVAEHLNAPEEIKKRAAVQEVELSFSVDKEGNPVNITVTKSLCEKCDSEAIRLLKEGPKWKGKKGKVKIRFQ